MVTFSGQVPVQEPAQEPVREDGLGFYEGAGYANGRRALVLEGEPLLRPAEIIKRPGLGRPPRFEIHKSLIPGERPPEVEERVPLVRGLLYGRPEGQPGRPGAG